jgi:hypothetical protein
MLVCLSKESFPNLSETPTNFSIARLQSTARNPESTARYADYVRQCSAHLGDMSGTSASEASQDTQAVTQQDATPYFFEGQLSQV